VTNMAITASTRVLDSGKPIGDEPAPVKGCGCAIRAGYSHHLDRLRFEHVAPEGHMQDNEAGSRLRLIVDFEVRPAARAAALDALCV
jgi:hypothetical protein